MHVHMLDCDLLLAFAAMAIERVEQQGIRPRELVCLIEILLPALESLLGKHTASIGFHRSVVTRHQLGGDHALQFVFRAYADQSLPLAWLISLERLAFTWLLVFSRGSSPLPPTRQPRRLRHQQSAR
jgi:hypothetical protein